MTPSHLHYRLSGHGAAIETAECVAPRTVVRTCHSSFMAEAQADLAFNRGLRRHPTLIATGDLPRFALLRTRPEATLSPSFIKLGDGRIRLSVDGGQPFWLDEAAGIRTTFLPHATEQRLPLPGPAGLACVLTVAHAANWGLVARLVIHNGSSVGRKVDVELVFGGLSIHGRTFSAAYFNPAQADQEAPQTRVQDHDGVAVMTREAFPETVAAALLPGGAWNAANGRAAFRHACEVAPGAEAGCGFVAGWGEDAATTLARVRAAEPEALLREAEAYAQALLDAAAIRTPDAVLDAAFACAVLELDRVWYDPAWLEGGHWWSAPWCNDFQILAALNLGQYARVRRTLEYCDSPDIGPCPNMLADGTPRLYALRDQAWGRLEGLPYYARQFLDYLEATDDEALARRIIPRLRQSLEVLWNTCDADGDGLLHWKKGCNCFLYQADHLALPGNAASPSLMLAGVLDGLAVWAERVGEQATATAWRARAVLIRENLVKKLWDEHDGAFYSHLDNQGLAHRARFYTDLVFPTLYSGLPEDYGRRSLEYLDRRLRVNVPAPETGAALALMRVGELKPNIFGNDNCMPAQMAEAARAYAALGRSADAHALLHGVALGATLFTEAPGSFPERLGHDGKGEPNFMFGNPIGSYLSGIVDGLFGLRLIEGGRALQVAPALPADWPEAAITVPYGRLTCRAGAEADGVREVRLEVTHASVRAARFAPWLPLKRVLAVSLNGVAVEDWKLKRGVGAWAVCVDAPPAARHELLIRFAPETPPATEVVMSPTAQEPVPPAVVPPVRGALRHLDLSAAFNAGHLTATSRWGKSTPRYFKELRANGEVETGLGPFRVATGETCLAFAEFGVCDPLSGKIQRSAHPATVTVPVGARIEALNLLYVTELASRLTGSQAGRLELRYATGAADVIPLVVGVQLDTLFSHFASATVPVPTGVDWGCANAWRIPCDPGRELVSAIVQIEVADVQFGLLAASVNEATCLTERQV